MIRTSGAPRVARVRGADGPQVGLAFFAVAELAAVRLELESHPHATAARVTVKQHVRDVNRHLARQAPPLGTLGMPATHVLVNAVDSLDDDLFLALHGGWHLMRAADVVADNDCH